MINSRPSSFRLSEENLAKLKALAKRDDMSLNKMINFVISKYSIPEEKVKKEPFNDSYLLKKELNFQRQRINVLQNQIDFLIRKSKDGKLGN